jgi:hypothetical protein
MKPWAEIQTAFTEHGSIFDHDNGHSGMCGRYRDPHSGRMFTVQASWGDGWEHVSVSTPSQTPKWADMQRLKELFWRDDEVVVQYHPARSTYVNWHPHCLHLWRPQTQEVPVPPTWMVGPIGSSARS